MPEPINYMGIMPKVDPVGDLFEGLKTGYAIQGLRQQNEANALALKQKQAAEERKEQYAIDLELAHKSRSPEAWAKMTSKYPEQREAFKQSWDMLSTEDKKHEFSQGLQAHIALQNKNIPAAKKVIENNIKALESSGRDAGQWKQILESIDANPEAAYTISGLYLSSVDPEKWGKVVETYGKEKKQPFEIREAAAKAGTAESEQVIKGVQAEEAPIVEKAKTEEQLAKTTTAESEALYSEKKQKLTVEKLGEEIGLTRAQIAEAKAKTAKARAEGAVAGGFVLPPDKRFDMTQKLRKEYLQNTQNFWDTKEAYNRVLASKSTGVGDISLIFGYMKMLDPGSVVREGEFATASNSGGIPSSVQNMYNKALNGESLTPSQRKTFKGQAKRIFENSAVREREVRKGIQNVAAPYGIRDEEVFYTKSPVPDKKEKAKDRKNIGGEDIAAALGFNMATYEQLKAQAIAAYKAGDDEKAEQIASMLKQAKATGAFTNIDGVSHLTATLPKEKERSIGEKIVGAGETALTLATGATGGLLGGVVGQGAAATEQLKRKVTGQPEMTERQYEEYAAEPSQALTYAPRSEAGQEYVGNIGKELAVLQYMNPMLAETAAIASLAKAARPQVSVMTAPARQAAGKVAQAIPSPKLVPTVSEGATEAVKAAEGLGINVMTSDIAKPQTFVGKSIQAASERIPVAGTGGMREAQQVQRIQAIKDVAQEFKADSPLLDLEGSVMSDLAKTRGDEVVKYAQMKRDVFDKTSGTPMEVTNATNAIDGQILKLQSLKSSELDPVVASLDDFKKSIQGQDIKSVEELRKILGEKFKSPDLISVKGIGDKAVSDIYGALKKDMENHIVQFGDRRDVTKWNIANKKLSIMSGELENNALKYTLKKGNVTPEVISRMLYSKKPSDLQMLYKNLSPEGRQNARSSILGKAYQDSLDADGQVSTAKFLTNIDKLDENAKVFFKGEDKAKLDGLKKALSLTRRADEAKLLTPTGQQLYPAAMAGAAGAAGGITGIFGLGTIGLIARAYESAPVRNALMRLSKAKTRSEQNVAMEKISEAIKQKSGTF